MPSTATESNHKIANGGPAAQDGGSKDDTISPGPAVRALAAQKLLPAKFLADLGVRDGIDGAIEMDFRDADGSVAQTRLRNPAGAGRRFDQPGGLPTMPYGRDRLDDAREVGQLCITEGETDSWALWYSGYRALGVPGAGHVKKIEAEDLVGIERLDIALDNDSEGNKAKERLLVHLGEIGFTGQAFRVQLPDGYKDVSDLRCADPEGFPARWAELLAQARPCVIPEPKPRKEQATFAPARPSFATGRDRQEKAQQTYATKALAEECHKVASTTEGRNNQLNTSAFVVGQLVGAGAIDRPTAERELLAAAEACGLPGAEARATVKSGLDKGIAKPRDLGDIGTGGRRDWQGSHTHTSAEAEGRASGVDPPAGEQENGKTGWALRLIHSKFFAEADYRPRWLVEQILVANQPVLVGGAAKTLKTTICLDMAISMANRGLFLGRFQVPRALRVAVLSGESGNWTLQETAKRICAARGIDLAGLSIGWQFDLPRLDCPNDRIALADGLQAEGIEVVFIDPLYLSLLSGAAKVDASNVYQMGAQLLAVAKCCLEAGTTPILVHHVTKGSARKMEEPLGLEDLAYAGCAEFARQWLLINRREAYIPGAPHRMRLLAGGSCGQGGLWAVDVDEGRLDREFGGRRWDVSVMPISEAQAQEQEAAQRVRDERRRAEEVKEEMALLAALDDLDKDGSGAGVNAMKDKASMSGDRAKKVIMRLKAQGIIEDVAGFTTKIGNGATRKAEGVRRVLVGDGI